MLDMLDMLDRLWALVRDYALPPRCPACLAVLATADGFCPDCWRQLDFPGNDGCAACGAALPEGALPGSRCGPCLAAPPDHDGIRAALYYGPVARGVAIRLKHGRRPAMARVMAALMAGHAAAEPEALLVPVPLHRWRLWRRGFNQSLLIARAIARQTGQRVAPGLIVRRRATPLLRGLGRRARHKALRGAFAVPSDSRAELAGRTVLLVDDVHTSGATANGCARALKRAGAARVVLLCWARVRPDAAADPDWPGAA
jgi:ComF family protein